MIFENTGKKSWNELDDNTKGLILLAYYEGETIQEWWENENEWEDFSLDTDGYYPEWSHGIWRIKPEPVKEVRWMNDYENALVVKWHRSRDIADLCSLPACDSAPLPARIAVIRREIVDGVVSYYKEDV